MFKRLLQFFIGDPNQRIIRKAAPVVEKINALELEYQALSDAQLQQHTVDFRKRFQEKATTLDDLLPEAYATAKNACRRLCDRIVTVCGHERIWDMVYFDVQLIGGIALHQNKIAEMATGEGKTLVATLPLYLNALTGRNCRLATVNDYLARRDSEWMGFLYQFLGLTVGCIQSGMTQKERAAAYACDITYGTASEFGFDYLRDNGMATSHEDQVQEDHAFCIVDEVDSILIDEARTPLIISGPAQVQRELPFPAMKGTVQKLVNEQNRLATRLVNSAQELLKSDQDDDRQTAFSKLLQVKLGAPKNKPFLRLMQDGAIRNPFDRYEQEINSELNKKLSYSIKEELYYTIDEKSQHADLTEKGRDFLKPEEPDAFLLPELSTEFVAIDKQIDLDEEERDRRKATLQEQHEQISEEIHCISQLLRAYSVYERDVNYIVKEGKVVIIDENTGRAMPRSRWGDGLHQAVEAKEGVKIEKETRTYATITLQNYFRLYDKLAGMTGTAETEIQEFRDIYALDVFVAPTHRPVTRKDDNDIIYKTRREKFNAVIVAIQEAQNRGQPVLVGTVSVEASELLSRMLKRAKVAHSVLNAKFHEQEAEIVARAGEKGVVTIATNMAGRGTDIKLSQGVAEAGGLLVIGTERHTSRRIDRQLRGRSGRQGDPGRSQFFISLEDDLLRLFANTGTIGKLLERSVGEGAIPLPSWVVEKSQKRVEEQRYASRRQLLQYDDVLSQQRDVIYSLRNEVLRSERSKAVIFELIEEEVEVQLEKLQEKASEEGQPLNPLLLQWAQMNFPIALSKEDLLKEDDLKALKAMLVEAIEKAYATKESIEDPEILPFLERYLFINTLDRLWQNHLTEMDELRQSVGLRGYGQKNPLHEYKKEAFAFFEEFMSRLRSELCHRLFRSSTSLEAFERFRQHLANQAQIEIVTNQPKVEEAKPSQTLRPQQRAATKQPQRSSSLPKARNKASAAKLPPASTAAPAKAQDAKQQRNALCSCGSGKKYKKCCGAK